MTFSREPLEVSRDSQIAIALSRQIKAFTGRDAVFSGMSGWLDSALLVSAGIPTVVLGPGGEGLHGETEWVNLESLHECREIVLATIKEFCR